MIKFKLTYPSLQVALVAAMSLFAIDQAAAENIDSFSFCKNTCKGEHCKASVVKDQCKKVCMDDSLWKHVASLELSNSSKEFRKEKDKKKKESMLYTSQIAQCLEIKTPELEKEPEKEPAKVPPKDMEKGKEEGGKTPQPTPMAPAETHTISSEELCAAALKHEMRDLKHDKAELDIQEQNLGAALRALGTGSAGEGAPKG